jgi:hypothetical protein
MPNSTDGPIESLDEEESWHLLASADLGRLAVSIKGGVDIFPINYVVSDRVIYFRSAPGSKLMDLTSFPVVALEADGTLHRHRWSVVAKGVAKRLDSDEEIETSGVRELHTLAPTDKWNYVRITVSSITGRQFTSSRRPA